MTKLKRKRLIRRFIDNVQLLSLKLHIFKEEEFPKSQGIVLNNFKINRKTPILPQISTGDKAYVTILREVYSN